MSHDLIDESALAALLKDVQLNFEIAPEADYEWKFYEFPVKDGDQTILGEIKAPAWFATAMNALDEGAKYFNTNKKILPYYKVEHLDKLIDSCRDFTWAKFHYSLPVDLVHKASAAGSQCAAGPSCKNCGRDHSGRGVGGGFQVSDDKQKVFIVIKDLKPSGAGGLLSQLKQLFDGDE